MSMRHTATAHQQLKKYLYTNNLLAPFALFTRSQSGHAGVYGALLQTSSNGMRTQLWTAM